MGLVSKPGVRFDRAASSLRVWGVDATHHAARAGHGTGALLGGKPRVDAVG